MEIKALEKRVEKLKKKIKKGTDDALAGRALRKQLKRAQRRIRALKKKADMIANKAKGKKDQEKAA